MRVEAAFVAWLVGLAMPGVAIDRADAGEARLTELLQDPSRFDGRHLVLQGTLTKLQAHVSRKGHRYYTFRLAENGRDLLVLAQGRPSCEAGAVVRVKGRFDGVKTRFDATTVTCK